jgi:VanZ like family
VRRQRHPLATPQARRALVIALVVGTAAVGVFVLGPTGDLPSEVVLHTHEALLGLGLPRSLTLRPLWAFVYNVALFVPVAFVCATLWRRVPVWAWTGLGLVASLCVESVQALFLAGRQAQVQDLVANTLGALLGALLARFAWWFLHRSGGRRSG